MASDATHVIDNKTLWGCGRSPFSVSYGKMMMWFFLISDALTFGGLLTALGFMKLKYAELWPASEDVFFHFPFTHAHLPLMYVAFMTFILIISSVTMVLAVEAGHRKDKKNITFWLFWTVIGGFIFLGSQVWEWATYIQGSEEGAWLLPNGHVVKEAVDGAVQIFGANLYHNEYGPQLYADFFFFVTGFYGFHVFSGVMINLIILTNVINNEYEKVGHYEMVEKAGLYWHFVDLVWVFVFTFYYLL